MRIWEWIKSLWLGTDAPREFNRWVVDPAAQVETWFAVWNADTETTEIHLLGEGLGVEAGRVLAADASKSRRLRRELEIISWTDTEIVAKAMLPQDGNTAEYIKHVSPKVFLPGYRLATLSDLVQTLQVGTFEGQTTKPPTWTTTGTETTGEGQLTVAGEKLDRITDVIVKTVDGYFLADGELNEGSTELLVTLPVGIATEDLEEVHLSARRYSSRIQTEVIEGPFDSATPSAVFTSEYPTWFNHDDPAGNWSGANAATAVAIPGIFFYTDGFVSAGGNGIRVTGTTVTDGTPKTLDFVYDVDPTVFYSAPDEGYVIVWSQDLRDFAVDTFVALDNTGTPLVGIPGDPYSTEMYFVPANSAAQAAGNESSWTLNLTPYGSPVPVTQISLHGLTGGDYRAYYDPTGAQAGLNPVGVTFVVWDQQMITIEDPTLDGVDIYRVEVRSAIGDLLEVMDNPIEPEV
jgi:hypothetical protein